MKRLKALLSFLAISLGLATMPLGAATSVANVPVVNGAWTFIGVPGFQAYGATTGSSGTVWGSATARIIDAADTINGTDYQVSGLEVPTWDGNFSNPVTATSTTGSAAAYNATNSVVTPQDPVSGAATGSDIYSTVGLMVLGDDTNDAQSSTTTHGGAVIAGMEWTPVVKNTTSSIRTMYIRSVSAAAPDIKIYYQADQEGNTFKIQYETSGATALSTASTQVTYEGTFNRAYVYERAAVLGTDFPVAVASSQIGNAGNLVSGILASFDMDLSDNELNSTKNNIEPNTAYEAFNGNTYATSDRATLDGNLTALWWDSDSQTWRQYRATGDGTNVTVNTASDANSAGTLGQFEQGRGYWVKLDPTTAGSTSGFVLGYDSAATIDHTDYIADGWNMLSFGDEYLAYSVTGMVLDVAAGGDINITDTYGATTLTITLTGIPADDCLIVNQAIDGNNTEAFTNYNLRCIPSTLASDDIVLLSTRRFAVATVLGATTPVDLTGTALTAETAEISGVLATNVYKSTYGTHALIIEPNIDLFDNTAIEGNISIAFPTDSAAGTQYAEVETLAGTVTSTSTAMGLASANIGATNNAIPLDMSYDVASTGDAVLLASNYRFFIKDATLVRTFSYDKTRADANTTEGDQNEENNATIRIVGVDAAAAITDVTLVDDDLTTTSTNINLNSATHGVESAVLNETNTTLMIFYSGYDQQHGERVNKIDLQEWGDAFVDVLTETDASSETNNTAKGAIAKVWQVSDIAAYTEDANGTNQFDGNYSFTALALTSDLGYTAVYAENFPVSGPLYDIATTYGKQAETIITGQTEATAGTFISWKQIDVSKDTSEWYDNDDQFELFWTEKEKGYWVYINGDSTNDLTINAPTISTGSYPHFNNWFGAATTATTRNHLNKTLTVVVDNLTDLGANANTDAYEVYATIGSTTTSFQRDSGTNQFTIPLDSHETNGISFDAGEVSITITAANGAGLKTEYTYTLDYSKPDITSATVDGATATVTITNGDATTIHVYSGDINDSNYGTSSSSNWAGSVTVAGETTTADLASMTGLGFPTAFENNASAYTDGTWFDELTEQIDEGLIRDVRFTALDSSGLYADQERLYYIPWKSGTGVLSHTTTSTTTYDAAPVVYTATGDANATYDGTIDDGVQLKNAGADITCVYDHENVTLNEAVAETRDLYVGSTSGTRIGTIMYMDGTYAGRPLICQTSSGVYVGAFHAAGEGTDTSAIIMQSVSSSVSVTLSK